MSRPIDLGPLAFVLAIFAFAWCSVEEGRDRVEERRISACQKIKDEMARGVCIGGQR